MSHTFFHPEAGKPVSSFNTSPQVSGKGKMLHSFSVHSIYPTFQFQCFHFNACGDTKTIFLCAMARAKKPLSTPPVDMYLTHFSNPITAGQDMLRGLSISFAYSLHLPDIRSLSVDWPSSLRWFCLWKWPTLQYHFSQGQRALNESSMLKTAVCPQEFLFSF